MWVSLIGKSGRVLSGELHWVDPRLVEVEVIDVSDDGYHLRCRYVSGAVEDVWLEGDIPASIKVVDPT